MDQIAKMIVGSALALTVGRDSSTANALLPGSQDILSEAPQGHFEEAFDCLTTVGNLIGTAERWSKERGACVELPEASRPSRELVVVRYRDEARDDARAVRAYGRRRAAQLWVKFPGRLGRFGHKPSSTPSA